MTYRTYPVRCLPALMLGLLMTTLTASAMSVIPLSERADAPVEKSSKPRLIVLTDMSSIEQGVREPDDAQSMIRLMLYANEFDIEGLIASSGLRHGQVVRPGNIRKIVDAYGKCQPNLALHNKSYPSFYNKRYPSANHLKRVIKSGQPNADERIPVFQSIGKGKDTEASRWIIKMADKSDSRPLWITAWGGTADLAQALWTVRDQRSPEQVAKFVAKLRVTASGDQDSTAAWIRSRFPDLYYVKHSSGSGRGMYRGGDQSLVSSAWVQKNIKGHGALGDIYPDYRGGDTYSYRLGDVEGIKGGDSSNFMGLIRNGLNQRDNLTWENWGGRLKPDGYKRYIDHAIDKVGHYRSDLSPYWAAVYRWRPAFQAEYAARFDWCTKSYSQANHVPVNSTGIKPVTRLVVSGQHVKLEDDNWRDPDGNGLGFHWQMVEEEGNYSRNVNIANADSRIARFTVPDVGQVKTIHVLLTVTDDGQPALSSYRRFNFTVFP